MKLSVLRARIDETEILSSGKRSPALEIHDYTSEFWDNFKAQMRATA